LNVIRLTYLTAKPMCYGFVTPRDMWYEFMYIDLIP
jgi:hypothetical protein